METAPAVTASTAFVATGPVRAPATAAIPPRPPGSVRRSTNSVAPAACAVSTVNAAVTPPSALVIARFAAQTGRCSNVQGVKIYVPATARTVSTVACRLTARRSQQLAPACAHRLLAEIPGVSLRVTGRRVGVGRVIRRMLLGSAAPGPMSISTIAADSPTSSSGRHPRQSARMSGTTSAALGFGFSLTLSATAQHAPVVLPNLPIFGETTAAIRATAV